VSAFSDVETFVSSSKGLTRMADLAGLLSDAVVTLGFDYVALMHHVQVETAASARWAVQVIDYPDAWRAQIRANGYLAQDPVLAACHRSAAGFLWSELPTQYAMNGRQTEILQSAFDCGLAEGFTVPLNVPGEFLGSCSFGLAPGRELPRETLPAVQYVGCFAFEAARRIQSKSQTRQLVDESGRKLTQRQFDCLILAAQGKSDWDIGQLLGIAGDTVHQHLEAAKRRYGVASRTQLVVRALFDSQITFADIMG
jgi:LuxR family quorum-sensing system transcriptional regulator CciR